MYKTQAMVISRRDCGVVVEHPPTVAGDFVVFSDSVKHLGLCIDNQLSRMEHVSRIVSRTYSTLRLLYFPSLTGLGFRRLELAFHACTRYMFGEFSRGILGYILFEYLELRWACFIHRISLVGAPSYLCSLLVLGRSSRHRFITVSCPALSTSLRGESTVYRGIRLWNVLPSAAKSCRGMSVFRQEVGQFLTASECFRAPRANSNG
jgi:hypothetical protein